MAQALKHDDPAIQRDLAQFVEILRKRKQKWTTAKIIRGITATMSVTGKGWDRRHTAMISSAANGRIISTTYGYKLQEFATEQEIQDAYHQLVRKAEETGATATKIIKYFHQNRIHKSISTGEEKETQPELF